MNSVAERAEAILDKITQNRLDSSDFKPQATVEAAPSASSDSSDPTVGGEG